MALSERLALLITANGTQAMAEMNKVGTTAERSLATAQASTQRLSANLTRAGVGFVTMGGLAAYGLYQAGQAASQLEQSVGGTEAVFGDASSIIEDFGATAAESMGLSERAFRDGTTRIGALLTNMGYSQEEAANKSAEMAQAAADLAATVGGSTAEALHAMGRALVGEFDPLESYAVSLRQADINARAVAMGLATSTESVDQNARAQAALSLITERSAFAQGRFAEEADTAAGSQAILTAQWENLTAQLGAAALPVMTRITGGLSSMVSGLGQANNATGGLLGSLAAWGAIGSLAVGGMLLVAGQALKLGATFTALRNTMLGVRVGLLLLNPAFQAVAAAAGIAALAAYANSLNDIKLEIDGISGASEEAVNNLASGWENMPDFVSESDKLNAFRESAESNIAAAERFGEAWTAAGGPAEEIARILRETAESNIAQGNEADAAAEANARLAGELEGGADAAEQQADALNELLTEIDSYLASVLDVPAGQDALQESFAELGESLRENGSNWTAATEGARSNRAAGRDVVSTFADLIGTMREQNASQAQLQATTALSVRELRRLRDQGVITGSQFQTLRTQILNTPGAVSVAVSVPGIETAISQMQRLSQEALRAASAVGQIGGSLAGGGSYSPPAGRSAGPSAGSNESVPRSAPYRGSRGRVQLVMPIGGAG